MSGAADAGPAGPARPGDGAGTAALAGVPAIAVLVVRAGHLPAGADETVAEAGGYALLAGSGTRDAAACLVAARRAWAAEGAPVTPAALAAALAAALPGVPRILLPASPDGRDLAPRLALELGRPLLAWAVRCAPAEVELTRLDDRLEVRVAVDEPVVVTLRPGAAGSPAPATLESVADLVLRGPDGAGPGAAPGPPGPDAQPEAVLDPEPGTLDLAEATRIVAGGAGLVAPDADGVAVMRLLADVGRALGASAGATRVVTDAGWMDYDRQIGTTGVAVNPALYIAFGISGAAQHCGGLGAPDHVVSVNTDPSCPMTALADLGLVADAPAVLAELAGQLGVPGTGQAAPPTGTEGDGHA